MNAVTLLTGRFWRLSSLLVLGFASGLPLALTGQALQAWLTTAGLSVAAIGMFSLVTQPYAYKFIWAPLMDRFEPPFLGRRRGWLVLMQLVLAGLIFLMSQLDPVADTVKFSLMAVGVAFFSSSQDIVIDAYRTDIAPADERGLSASLGVFGYRLGMILSGGVAFILADSWGWGAVYRLIAMIMVGLAVFSIFTPMIPSDAQQPQRQRDFGRFVAMVVVACGAFYAARWALSAWVLTDPKALGLWYSAALALPPLLVALAASNLAGKWLKFGARQDINGFIYMLMGILVAYFVGDAVAQSLKPAVSSGFAAAGMAAAFVPKWADLVDTLIVLAFAIPGAYWGAKLSQFQLLLNPLRHYFDRDAAWLFLLLIVFYKLGDAFAGNLTTAFLLKGVQFTQTEVGLVNKMFGMVATIVGAILGGALMLRLGLFRALLFFGVLQALSNMGFWVLAQYGKDAWGHFALPTGVITQVLTGSKTVGVDVLIDNLLLFVVCFENITGGMGTAAFVALLMGLSSSSHSLVHYALLSAFATIGRIYVGPISGVLSETIGWPNFFIFATIMAIPGLWLLLRMRQRVLALA
ncbi:MAG: AmpG family muropeptide MFS transporter [Formosimonas sp.]